MSAGYSVPLLVTESTPIEVRDIPIIILYYVHVPAEVVSHNFPERFFVDACTWLTNNMNISINSNLIPFTQLPIYLVPLINLQERAYGNKQSVL